MGKQVLAKQTTWTKLALWAWLIAPACSGSVTGRVADDAGTNDGAAGTDGGVGFGGSSSGGGAATGATGGRGGRPAGGAGGVGGFSSPCTPSQNCDGCPSCLEACLCQTADIDACTQACATPTGGSGGTGGASGGAGGTGGLAVDCGVPASAGVPGSCVPDDGNDSCQLCLQSACCEEVQHCYATSPVQPCLYGGPHGEGEIICFQICLVDAQLAGGVPDDATIVDCANRCVTPGCGTISEATNDLIGCAASACMSECFVP